MSLPAIRAGDLAALGGHWVLLLLLAMPAPAAAEAPARSLLPIPRPATGEAPPPRPASTHGPADPVSDDTLADPQAEPDSDAGGDVGSVDADAVMRADADPVNAMAVAVSRRPVPRPRPVEDAAPGAAPDAVAEARGARDAAAGAASAGPLALAVSPRPVPRPGAVAGASIAGSGPEREEAPDRDATSAPPGGFAAWRAGFAQRARAAGIAPAVVARTVPTLRYAERVVAFDRNQSEFNRQLWDYLGSAVSAARIANGQAALSRQSGVLARIEARHGVAAEIVAAIWGLESAYGVVRGDEPVLDALATLAFEGRRRDFFEAELIAALRILQDGDVAAVAMRGSWAGAMGHTQFMPTSYLAHARDFDGDGARDIWSDDPADALASTAAYLAANGWVTGQPWGMEVVLPAGFDIALTGERIRRPVAFWNDRGVRLAAGGGPIPDHGEASILLPGGADAVALVIWENFRVIERYNTADAYVIAVGHLADRIAGGPAFEGGWPDADRAFTHAERVELQERLIAEGIALDRVDGIIGPETIQAVRDYQAREGLVPDGYANIALLQRLR